MLLYYQRHRLFACVILNKSAGELHVELVICSKPQTDPLSEALAEKLMKFDVGKPTKSSLLLC